MKKCEKQYPEVGHEEEGYSCSTHNMPWDECIRPTWERALVGLGTLSNRQLMNEEKKA